MRVAVVGHVEWVDFIAVDRFPEPGDVVHGQAAGSHAGGAGSVVAAVLVELGGEVDFFTALGRDRNGEAAAAELAERGVRMHVAWREAPTRRAVTLLGTAGERTIVTVGERLQPLGEDELDWPRLRDAAGVYFTAGDAAALTRARAARVLTASPRGRGAFEEHASTVDADAPALDALIFSAHDRDERAWAERIASRARLLVATESERGGRWWGESSGRWQRVEPPGPVRDAYGCGDSFAAAFTFGLADGRPVAEAARLGAQWGARALTRVGVP
jgi:ribokinase